MRQCHLFNILAYCLQRWRGPRGIGHRQALREASFGRSFASCRQSAAAGPPQCFVGRSGGGDRRDWRPDSGREQAPPLTHCVLDAWGLVAGLWLFRGAGARALPCGGSPRACANNGNATVRAVPKRGMACHAGMHAMPRVPPWHTKKKAPLPGPFRFAWAAMLSRLWSRCWLPRSTRTVSRTSRARSAAEGTRRC